MKKNLLLIVLLTVLALFSLSGCGSKEEAEASRVPYTIIVETEGGLALPDVKVLVYENDGLDDLVWAAETDDEGCISFEALESETYVAVIEEGAEDYVKEETYLVTAGETLLQLKMLVKELEDSAEVFYKLGSIIRDHVISDTNGNQYRISEVLQEKKVVILNFWFLECGPCRMEFPFMQEAYEEYKDDIEIFALNPLDGTNETIAAYAEELGLSFPMGVGDASWVEQFELSAYPTTVVIDRYGMICMLHKGSITDKETFTKIFAYFSADDYKQTTFRNLSDME